MRTWRAWLLIAIVCGLAAINFGVGIGEDPDAYLVAARGHAFPTHGYAPSRTWGFPLYELAAYPLIAYVGETAAKAWSAACIALAAVAFLAVLDRITTDRWRALAGAIGFTLLPITVIASTTVLETAQGIVLAIVTLLAWLRWRESRGQLAWWYAFATALGAAIATRPDYVLFAGAFGVLALVAGPASVVPRAPHVIASALLTAACALLPYVLLYGRFPFTLDVVPPDPWLRRLVRAVFGLAALIGLPALVVLGAWIARRMLRATQQHAQTAAQRDVMTLAAVAGLLYFVRFVGLPDELDYVYVLAPLLIATVVASRMSTLMVGVLAGLLAVPNVVQVHLFMRTAAGTIALAPGLSAGAIAQERAARRRQVYISRELPATLDRVAARFGVRDYTTDPVPGGDRPVIIPEDALRFYRTDRRGGTLRATAQRSRLIVYPLATGRGWRQFLAPTPWRPVTLDDFHEIDARELHD